MFLAVLIPEVPCSLKDGVDGGAGGAVEGRQSDLVVAAVGHQREKVVAGDDTWRHDSSKARHLVAVVQVSTVIEMS